MERRVALAVVLGVHLLAAVAHGLTHGLIPVWLPPWQNGLVLLTTFVAPAVGMALAWRDHPLGTPVFTLGVASALVLGLTLHAVVESPDHLAAVPPGPWQLPFRMTAVALAVIDGVGVGVGAWYWRTPARGGSAGTDATG